MTIMWPSDTNEIINAIRNAVGREVEFRYVAGTIPCSACNLDPVTNTSDNSFCPVCSGEYWIKTISGYTVNGFVTWGPSDRPEWQSGGQMLGGDCIVQIALNDDILAVLDKTLTVIVDTKKMEIRKKQVRGVKPLNRVLLSLIEKE